MLLFDCLREKGLILNVTDDQLREELANKEFTFYIGFDPTVSSLHIGHLLALIIIKYMQKYHHRVIILLGGETATIGDPSSRKDSRPMLSEAQIDMNCTIFEKQIRKILNLYDEKDGGLIVNNKTWLQDLNYVQLIKQFGTIFSMQKMIKADNYKQKRDLNFLELNYMVMQAYDFFYLYYRYGCRLQIGGNDQWSNICSGINLIKQKNKVKAYGITTPLLTYKGKKIGKSVKGTIWLDKERTPIKTFYDYFFNINEKDLHKYLGYFTFLSKNEIDELIKDKNRAREQLADEITRFVHGDNYKEEI